MYTCANNVKSTAVSGNHLLHLAPKEPESPHAEGRNMKGKSVVHNHFHKEKGIYMQLFQYLYRSKTEKLTLKFSCFALLFVR